MALVPVYIIVEVPSVKVPVMTRGVPLPDRVIVLSEAFNVPAFMSSTPATERLLPGVHDPPLPFSFKELYELPNGNEV